LYHLQRESLLRLDRMAEKSVDKLLAGIEASKAQPFERVLFAVGIRYVGETVAKKLARHFKSLDELIAADRETLINVEEIGERIADSILDYFQNHDNLAQIQVLRSAGLQFESGEEEAQLGNALEGKSIVVSGVFQTLGRNELKALIEAHGGKNVGSISAKTDYVVAGENMGPAKLQKAQDLGITILNEEQFLALLG
ncbi:MAG: NAD-dependent DNA ligase LigA, partial [Flavobacteriales bacterium]|nr:NAD-dependent DNA ligase LigA [Flavobacteriales bacterium]